MLEQKLADPATYDTAAAGAASGAGIAALRARFEMIETELMQALGRVGEQARLTRVSISGALEARLNFGRA